MSYMGIQELKDADLKSGSATGDGSTTTFAIGWTPPSEQSLFVTINGVLQSASALSLSGANCVFTAAPASGDAIEFKGIQSSGTVVTTTGDGTIDAAKLADNAVTSVKIIDDAVTEPKLNTTGTASASTYLSGTMAWTAISSEDSVKVLSKAVDYTILPADVSDVGTLYVMVDASAATRTITLPTPANYSGVVIKVIASVAPGSGYSVIVNNSGASEIWTCYAIGDFYTGISDGTSNIKADGKVTVRGKIYSSANQTPTGKAYVKTTYDTSKYDVGGWGDLTNNRINVGFDCIISVMSVVNCENQGHPVIYVDGTNQMDTHDNSYESSGYQREVTFVQKVLASQTPIEMYYYVDYSGLRTMRGGEYKVYSTWQVLERI